MDLLFWFHLLLTISIFTIPFWPITYLKYGVFIPLIISLIWLLFDGCPLTKLHNIDSSSFSQDILRFFIPNASLRLTEHFNTFILIAVTFFSFYRLCKLN